METPVPGYSHTQKAPLCLLVYATAVWLLVAGWLAEVSRLSPRFWSAAAS